MWSSDFCGRLGNRTLKPMFILEYAEVYDEPGSPYAIASHAGLGADVRIASVSVQGQTLNPQGWSGSYGSFSVVVVGGLSILQYWTRGTVVQLKVGFPGMTSGAFQGVALGMIRNVRRMSENSWSIECFDVLTAMQQRLQTISGNYALFSLIGTATTLSVGYVAGSPTVLVASVAGFERETGGSGVIKITPDSGDPFYLTYTGTTTGPDSFTGCSAAGQLGTTAGTASIGNAVVESAYVSDHPLDAIRKVLVSRAASNGDYDTLPASWGLGIADQHIDHDDIDDWKGNVVKVSSGSYVWDLVSDTQQDSALSWLQAYMVQAGLFFAIRQGQLTIRAGQPCNAGNLRKTEWAITDSQIIEIEDWEAYASGYSQEYSYLYAATGTGSSQGTATDAATLPFYYRQTYDMSTFVWSNESAVRTEILGRLAESGTRVPERLVLRCATLVLAQLCIGDVVTVSTRHQWSRSRGVALLDRVPALVDEVSPDWTGGTVRVGLLIYPVSEDVFP